ncbi:MAG: substrate-binding domain-containing protein [Spirochaetales bacterium]|nr:substrate-binding domain-containing protein [Spirochaetales bacterium]
MQMDDRTIHMIVEPNYITPFWYARSIEGLEEAASRHKQEVKRLSSIDELTVPANVIVVIGTTKSWIRDTLDAARARNLRSILIGTVPSKYGEDVSGTMYGSHSAIEEIVYYFYYYGHRKMALVDINGASTNDAMKVESFLSTTKKLGLSTSYNDVYFRNVGAQNGDEKFLISIRSYDAVVCSNDYSAAFILKYAEDHGIKVPDELFVAGLGDTTLCRYTNPSLTSATRSYYESGENAYDLWRTLTRNPNVESIVTTMRSSLKPRGSTGFLPGVPVEISSSSLHEDREEIDENTLRKGADSLKAIQECLSECDAVDMSIIAGVLNNVSNERLAEELSMSTGTINYRLKKLYKNAGVTTKNEFSELIRSSISVDTLLKDTKHLD